MGYVGEHICDGLVEDTEFKWQEHEIVAAPHEPSDPEAAARLAAADMNDIRVGHNLAFQRFVDGTSFMHNGGGASPQQNPTA